MLLASAPPWRILLRKDLLSQGRGTIWHPRPDLWNLHIWSLDATRRNSRDLSPAVVNTIIQARAPYTRRLDDLKWHIFVNWCSSQGKDPRKCGIRSVLSFLQEGLDRHLSASTLKVYVAAIVENHDTVEGRSVGKDNLVIRFLRGALWSCRPYREICLSPFSQSSLVPSL